ncbi:MAG: hypothetical protein HY925_13825 [Elusimicrobia bacterium]|nr:hypothetical protein [Elusimicrobiota bacterium]
MAKHPLRTLVARTLSLTLILTSWPAWAQTARVVVNVPVGQTVAPAVNAAPQLPGGGILSNAATLVMAGLALVPGVTPTAAGPRRAADRAAQAVGLPPRAVAQSLAAAAPASEPVPGASGSGPFVSEEAVRGKKVVLVGTKSSKPFILEEAARVAKQLGVELFLVDDPELRKNSKTLVDDAHFIPATVNDRSPENAKAIAELVAAHPVAAKAEVVASFLSSHAKVTAAITDKLEAAGIPGSAVAAADDKVETRRVLNKDASLAVPFREIHSADDARAAYREMGGRVVIKSVRGENSRFLALGIDSEEAAAKAYTEMDEGLKAFAARPESKQTTFSSHPGIFMEQMLEKAPGSEETSVEVIMQNGKVAFAMVSDTKSIGRKLELAAGSITFPSVQPQAVHQAFIEASAKALAVLGITDGNARLDMILTKEGPKVVEVNPFMGGANIFRCIQVLTGMSMVEQGMRALLGLEVDPGHAPDGFVDYRFWASKYTGTVTAVHGLEEAKAMPGIVDAKALVEEGDTTVAAHGQSYEEIGEIIGKGATLEEAMSNNIAALKKVTIDIMLPVRQTAEHLQPEKPDTPAPDPDAKPQPAKLWTTLVMGFMSTFAVVSAVVESTSLAVSQMTQPLTQGFMALAILVSTSYIAYSAGSFLGGRWVDKFGIARAYRTVLATRAVIWTVIATLFNPLTGTVALPALVALFSLDYFVHSIGRVAEHKLQYELFKDQPTNSSRFGSLRDFIEYSAVFFGSLMGLAVAKWGFAAVLYPAPIAFAIAAAIALTLGLPKASSKVSLKEDWAVGFKAVFANKGILMPLSGYMLVNSFLYLLYYIIGTAFGAYVAGGDPAQAAAVSGAITGVYSIGALLGAVAMERVSKRIDAATENLPESERTEAGRKLYSASASKSLIWAAAGLLGTWAFTSQAVIGHFVWPFFWVSPALLIIGYTAQKALIHLDTLMKDRIPKGDAQLAGSILGAIRTMTYLSFVGVFLLWGGIFAAVGAKAFWWFGLFYTAVAGGYVWFAKKLNPSSKPK